MAKRISPARAAAAVASKTTTAVTPIRRRIRATTPRKAAAKPPSAQAPPSSLSGRSALSTLTAAQRAQLATWLGEQGMPPEEVSAQLLSEFGLTASPAAVSHWWVGQLFAQGVRASSQLAAELQSDLEALPIRFDPELISRASQAKFEAEVSRERDLKEHIALRRLQQTDRSQSLAERALKLRRAQGRRQSAHSEQRLKLSREKFEFNAAELALTHIEAIKTIAADRALPRAEKLDAIRQRLFGEENDE